MHVALKVTSSCWRKRASTVSLLLVQWSSLTSNYTVFSGKNSKYFQETCLTFIVRENVQEKFEWR